MLHARFTIDPAFTIGPVERRLFGSFVEHLGRCVYDGIYEPSHPSANANGFRQDVLALVSELGVTTVRYPGGNFVSGYRWEDGVGPREERPSRVDLAWHSVETNQVGTDEFAAWAAEAGTELMLAVNLGTRGVQEALDLLEYTNVRSGTTLSDSRIANGTAEPHRVKMWCLGNEMDGPWQLGHRTAESYGALASQVAKGMRQLDPSVELVVCGSSNSEMPTFGSWERTVLEHSYDDVDYISCHVYYEEYDGDVASFLASGVDMDRFIEAVVATIDSVRAEKRSDRVVNISFDEWNVWYRTRYHAVDKITDIEQWPYAPRILEDVYTVTDAVVVGSLLISLLNHADRVTAASLAQLVNVIAPIMTEPGGPAWRQTTFFPFATTARLAHGEAMRLSVIAPNYDTERYGTVPLVDAAATVEWEAGSAAIFLVNRSQDEAITLSIDVAMLDGYRVVGCATLADDDRHAANTREEPERVAPADNTTATITGGVLTVELPPISWSAVELAR